MNQNFVAGLGNIYCSEILFDAKKYALKKNCKKLNNKQMQQIIRSTKNFK